MQNKQTNKQTQLEFPQVLHNTRQAQYLHVQERKYQNIQLKI